MFVKEIYERILTEKIKFQQVKNFAELPILSYRNGNFVDAKRQSIHETCAKTCRQKKK